jgi:hypothetical protein
MAAILAFAETNRAPSAINVACIGAWWPPGFAHRARSRRELPIDRLGSLLLDGCRLLHRVDRLLPAFLRHS